MSEQQLAGQQIRPPAGVGRGPVDFGLELRDRPIAQAEIAVPGPTALQGGQLVGVEGEIGEVPDLRRIAEPAGEPELGRLAEAGDVLQPQGEPFRLTVDPHCGQHADIARILCRQQLRDRLAALGLCNLGRREAETLPEHPLGVDLSELCGSGQHGQDTGHTNKYAKPSSPASHSHFDWLVHVRLRSKSAADSRGVHDARFPPPVTAETVVAHDMS